MDGIVSQRIEPFLAQAIERLRVPWYEAHGVGRVKFKIKRFLD
jgi:hypothetical protein